MQIESFEEGKLYHIYNRGINSTDIIFEERNYDYLLQQYQKYCSPVLDTYAYAILKNHFHFIVYVKPNIHVPRDDGNGMIQLNASKQLSHFFNSYTQSINKAYNRTGSLFESPFERKWINSDNYLTNAILYCHLNPLLHNLVSNFKAYPYTSYNAIVNDDTTIVNIHKVLDWFGGQQLFKEAHLKLTKPELFNQSASGLNLVSD